MGCRSKPSRLPSSTSFDHCLPAQRNQLNIGLIRLDPLWFRSHLYIKVSIDLVKVSGCRPRHHIYLANSYTTNFRSTHTTWTYKLYFSPLFSVYAFQSKKQKKKQHKKLTSSSVSANWISIRSSWITRLTCHSRFRCYAKSTPDKI